MSSIVLPFLILVLLSDPLALFHRPWSWQRVSLVDGLFVLYAHLSLVLHGPALSDSCSSL
jgi:hypothetical protein